MLNAEIRAWFRFIGNRYWTCLSSCHVRNVSLCKVTGFPVLNARWSRKWKGYSEFENCRAIRIPVHFSGRIIEEENPQCQQQQKMESDRQDNYQRGAGPTGTAAWLLLLCKKELSCLEYTVGLHLCVKGDNDYWDKTKTDADTWWRRHCYWWIPKRCCPGSLFWGPGKNISLYWTIWPALFSLLSALFSISLSLSLSVRVCSCSCAHMFLGIEPRMLHMLGKHSTTEW